MILPESIRLDNLLNAHYGVNDKPFFLLEYDPEICLTPDEVTIKIAKIAANYIESFGYTEILELGTGSGIFSTSLLLNLTNPQVHITATDIDENALNIAYYNLSRAAKSRSLDLDSFSIKRADWFDGISLHRGGKYDFIYANPPFLSRNMGLLPEFEKNPPHTVYGENQGIEHFDVIFEGLGDMLFDNGIALIRMSAKPIMEKRVKNSLVQRMPRSKFDTIDIPSTPYSGKVLVIEL
jgi:methylase of polypeptide subunit release factors